MLRVIFMGTPDFSIPTLMEVIGQGHQVAACYTQPPRSAGRGMAKRPSPMHQAVERFGIKVRTPASLKSAETLADFQALEADVVVVVAYGLILPQAFLDAPEHGCLNLHASLLPRWRGAAPINRAVMAGDTETGVAVMRMEAGLDTGPVAMVERTTIQPADTAGDVHDRLARLGGDLMARALGALERGSLRFEPQAGNGITYAEKVDKRESRIDFNRPASEVLQQIHGLSPFPGAWCEMQPGGRKPERLKLLRIEVVEAPSDNDPGVVADDDLTIHCGTGAIRPLQVQRAGKSVTSRADFLRGVPLGKGDRLT